MAHVLFIKQKKELKTINEKYVLVFLNIKHTTTVISLHLVSKIIIYYSSILVSIFKYFNLMPADDANIVHFRVENCLNKFKPFDQLTWKSTKKRITKISQKLLDTWIQQYWAYTIYTYIYIYMIFFFYKDAKGQFSLRRICENYNEFGWPYFLMSFDAFYQSIFLLILTEIVRTFHGYN